MDVLRRNLELKARDHHPLRSLTAARDAEAREAWVLPQDLLPMGSDAGDLPG